jgi:tetratricopeptide (TPR) repeat protein
MFQIVVSLAIGILIGWNFHMYYMALESPKMLQYESITSQDLTSLVKPTPKIVTIESTANNQTIQKVILEQSRVPKELSFQMLLEQDNFSDAMELYMNIDEPHLIEYQLALKAYFYDRIDRFPKKTIEDILYYMEIEPESKDIPLYLAKYYSEKGEFQKSIKLLFRLQEIHPKESSKPIQNNLNSTI